MNIDNNPPAVRKSTFTVADVQLQIQHILSEKELEYAVSSKVIQDMVGYMLVQLTVKLKSITNDDVIVIEYPADWAQAVKARFAPRWLLRKYPVVLTHHRITGDTLVPADVVRPGVRRIARPMEWHVTTR